MEEVEKEEEEEEEAFWSSSIEETFTAVVQQGPDLGRRRRKLTRRWSLKGSFCIETKKTIVSATLSGDRFISRLKR